MAITLHDAVVRPFIQTVGAVGVILDRGLSHCMDNAIAPEDIVKTRLHPEMLPFRFQVLSVVHHSIEAIDDVRKGVSTPPTSIEPLDYEQLQKKIAEALAALKALDPAEVNAFEGRDMRFEMGELKIPFTAEGFLLSFSLPNLHFHATTAYDILRHKGAPLGKRDYLGHMRMKV
jgi:hypothetical protein